MFGIEPVFESGSTFVEGICIGPKQKKLPIVNLDKNLHTDKTKVCNI